MRTILVSPISICTVLLGMQALSWPGTLSPVSRPCRNIEEILAERGEEVVRADASTVEIAGLNPQLSIPADSTDNSSS